MAPLMKIQIKKMCAFEHGDADAIVLLKQRNLTNVERRLKENDFLNINQVFDPMTNRIIFEDESIMKAFDQLGKRKGTIATTINEHSTRPNTSRTMSTAADMVPLNSIKNPMKFPR